jgi:hypothetical protein
MVERGLAVALGDQMLQARSLKHVERARGAIARIGKLSDNVIGVGPFGIGLDGMLAWVPGLGDVYSIGAGGLLLALGLRARVPVSSLVQVGAIIGVRTGIGAAAIPLLGPVYAVSGALVDLFRGHKMSAELLIKAIDKTVYIEGRKGDPMPPERAEQLAAARAKRMRVVYLG